MQPVDSSEYNLKEKVIILKATIVKALDSVDEKTDAYEILSKALNYPTQQEKQAILNNAIRVMNR